MTPLGGKRMRYVLLFWFSVVLNTTTNSLFPIAEKEGHVLSPRELDFRYRFTLMSLVRSWQAPWTPASHASFQPGFREAVKTISLCTHRLNMPNEIAMRVSTFLSRQWWPDERRQCWSYACQAEQVYRQMQRKSTSNSAAEPDTPAGRRALTSFPCPNCQVAWYCSAACQEDDFKAGHKKGCCAPPFISVPSPSEYELYRAVFKDSIPSALVCVPVQANPGINNPNPSLEEDSELDIDGDDANEDDDGSWESFDSNDSQVADEVSSTTRVICEFFKSARRVDA
jgi:hypothetical protein